MHMEMKRDDRLVMVMTVLDAACAWWDGEDRFFRRPGLEDAMRGFETIHLPHFRHFSTRAVVGSAREKLIDHSIEITMAVTILFGVLMVLAFWAVVAR